ncbi:HNH endonuclease [Streptomyces sp. NPDC058045]|uniref:HNH endonuclease signature motif containing protein n=1 Tax=Streptomyces sp. NPDC058045 TaxID=3346311 RepID=UPI0036E165DE
MAERIDRETLADAVAGVDTWAALLRRLGLKANGASRRRVQREVAALGLDTGHFTRVSPWRKFSDADIAAAAASASSLREVALALGATPASGTMSHLSQRMAKAGLDTRHFSGMQRQAPELPFTQEELATAAAGATSVRCMARRLGIPDDGRSRAALLRMVRAQGIDTSHFRHHRVQLDEEALRRAVPEAAGYAEVMRALGLDVTYANHRRVQRAVIRLGLDTGHFTRRSWRRATAPTPRPPVADTVLVVLPPGAARRNRDRLHHALQERGVPYRCAECGNTGSWRGRPITLQIDHISGDWHDNRQRNLRYLCPNCHALTATWCRRKPSRQSASAA